MISPQGYPHDWGISRALLLAPFHCSPGKNRFQRQIMPDRPQNPPQTGHEVIRKHLRQLDNAPGVYRMLDAQSRVLYVGKARALKKRVSSYAKPTGHSPRIARMIRETASMMFLTTRTETEALLLEQNLIKQLKPKYNVLLRDDKSFPNILVSRAHPFPQIKKHRGAKKEKGDYFGPFASAGAVNRTLNQLQKVFLLRNCSDATFDSRTRPCLLYQIKRCSAPCVGYISEAEYEASVADAVRFLKGDTTDLQAQLAAQMAEASEAMEFERAAALRDRIRALTNVQSSQGHQPSRRAGGRCHRAPHGRRAGLRSGLLHPRQPELGQQGLLPPRRSRYRRARGAGGLRRSVLRPEGPAEADDPVAPDRECGPDGRRAVAEAGAQGRDPRAAAGREGGTGGTARCATPAKASPARWRRGRRRRSY
jgi:hypothetical protein